METKGYKTSQKKVLHDGIQHLCSLAKLSLYYNHISYLSEVFRLQLTALQGLDLHLNWHVKKSDYCLFIVLMLPSLRQLYHAFKLSLPQQQNEIDEIKRSSKVTFSESKTKDLSKKDPNLKCQDAEAYDKITVQANFTTHPDSLEIYELSTSSEEHIQAQESSNTLSASELPSNRKFYFQENHKAKALAVNKHVYEATPMKPLLDIVDKYCHEGGGKTLQIHLSEQKQQHSLKINDLMSELSSTNWKI
ncbi:LOW QUALITY PROTEIN: centrosomal protein of 72 kDa [Ciconia maguari]